MNEVIEWTINNMGAEDAIIGPLTYDVVVVEKTQLESALAAIGHLRQAAKTGDRGALDHALAATSGYEERHAQTP